MLYVTSPSSTKSSTPVTVTVCGFSAEAFALKFSTLGDTVPSAVLLEERLIETFVSGTLVRAKVNVSVRPAPVASVVTSPLFGVTATPATSSSMFVTDTSSGLIVPSYFGSVLAVTAVMMLYATVPSSIESCTPVSVTVCAVCALTEVNVRLEGDTVPSPVSLEDSPIVTSEIGSVFSFTVNDARPPASVVVGPLVGVTVTPATSSSMFVTDTSSGLIPV